ncbi:hypothetical protein CAEBREN_23406 [Caenorhabditis brenneri]|uniref:Uncharacterized protein n=1 Tax=Caenorhabditis brenneri TaxID=135651 RepID=G0NSQ4_CAEBE|nr:hypothetical protein CAEBREN_23406 [Caenorhabditis brenneri]
MSWVVEYVFFICLIAVSACLIKVTNQRRELHDRMMAHQHRQRLEQHRRQFLQQQNLQQTQNRRN